ncbi:hypothetical protein RvY_09420 [Ramazzottius varieornatus]|uniref:Mitochondrial import inner membrane translocase subunit Tim21 n=1 Tax=Ramazzottius varieornatus TaxID=947166 RepID=A0A1D1V9A8_RAMVA|nr:hypothetical protein RvY_09420 [Ramazzottius varieornatus]
MSSLSSISSRHLSNTGLENLKLFIFNHHSTGRNRSYSLCAFARRTVWQQLPSMHRTPRETSRKLQTESSSNRSLPSTHVSSGEKVKQASKDVFYTGVVVAGISITGLLGYLIFRELFSSNSANGVYKDALKLCKNDIRVQSILGSPVKAHGETSRRGHRNHILSAEWKEAEAAGGDQHIIQVKFHVQGPFNRGTVYAEKNVTKGEYRTLIFQTDNKRERFSFLEPPEPQKSIFALA